MFGLRKQNTKQGMIPREDNASDLVLESLAPYTKENGGPLEVERVHFAPGRGNVIIKYQGDLASPVLQHSKPIQDKMIEDISFMLYRGLKSVYELLVYTFHAKCVHLPIFMPIFAVGL